MVWCLSQATSISKAPERINAAASTRIALHYRTPGILKRAHLRRATVLEDKDPDIPAEILEFLGRKRDMVMR